MTQSSRPRLAPSLERHAGEAFDKAMRRRIRLNGVAEFMMDGMDGTRPISRIADEVSAEFGIPDAVALADTISFAEKLQEYGFVDAGSSAGQSLRFAVLSLLVSGGSVQRRRTNPFARQKRVDVHGPSFVGILAQVAPRVSLGLLSLAGLLALVLGWSMLALADGVLYAVLVATGASFALVLGVSLHESAHLYAVRRLTGDENLGYMRISLVQISIIYPNLGPERNFWVAMSGPLCPVVCGVILYCVNVLYSTPLVAASALLLVAHTTSYIPVPGSDGTNLLEYATGGRNGPRHDRPLGTPAADRGEER